MHISVLYHAPFIAFALPHLLLKFDTFESELPWSSSVSPALLNVSLYLGNANPILMLIYRLTTDRSLLDLERKGGSGNSKR